MTVVPISVDDSETGKELTERLSLAIPLYSDVEGKAAAAWDVWDPDTEIALAATFVVAPGGEVIYRYVGADKTDRPTVEAMVALVRDHAEP